MPQVEDARAGGGDRLTVLVPAYNEAASLADTIRSLQGQTSPPRGTFVICRRPRA